MDKFFSIFGKVVLVLIILGAITATAFYLGKKNITNESQSVPVPTFTETPTTPTQTLSTPPTVSPTPTPTIIVKQTISAGVASGLSFSLYTIEVPGDWEVSKEHKDTESPYDRLKLSKYGYELSIFQAATGGAICLYPGDPAFEGPSSEFKSFVELKGAGGQIYRRSTNNIVSGGVKGFTICQKYTDSIGQPTQFGHIGYKVPVNFDEGILKEMDEMVASLKKK